MSAHWNVFLDGKPQHLLIPALWAHLINDLTLIFQHVAVSMLHFAYKTLQFHFTHMSKVETKVNLRDIDNFLFLRLAFYSKHAQEWARWWSCHRTVRDWSRNYEPIVWGGFHCSKQIPTCELLCWEARAIALLSYCALLSHSPSALRSVLFLARKASSPNTSSQWDPNHGRMLPRATLQRQGGM